MKEEKKRTENGVSNGKSEYEWSSSPKGGVADCMTDTGDGFDADEEAPVTFLDDWIEFESLEQGTKTDVCENGLWETPVSCRHHVNVRRTEIASVEEYVERFENGNLARSLSCTKISLCSGATYVVLMPYDKVMALV